jgi:hypothetical protein
MAEKSRVPRPPVQAPKRRDSRRARRAALPVFPIWAWLAAGAALAAIIAAAALYASSGGGKALPLQPVSALGTLVAAPPPGPIGPESVPIPHGKALAPARGLSLGQTLDGITCQPIERLSYHIHAHLTIFADGGARVIPYGIGIAPPRTGTSTPAGFFVTNGGCFAWLHTHASDGIIHIESPSPKTYTLGDFFDIWHQPLGPNRVGSARGHVTAFYNGRYYTGNPRLIPLTRHAQIQLDIGHPLIAPESITFPPGL